MGMSVQKKFICGLASFILFIGLVGFIIGFFARPSVDKGSCNGAKNGNGDTSGMLTYEKDALDLVLAERIRHYLKYFGNESHISRTNESCNQAQFIKKEWNSFGLNTVELKRYDVQLWYPKRPSEVMLVNGIGKVVYSSKLIQKKLHTLDGESRNKFPFSVYSASGVATGKLLYANYGREDDFKYLEDKNITCAGKIVLLRYGKIHEATKVANAQKWKAAGILMYLDPIDYTANAPHNNLTEVTWYPSDTDFWENKGDPLTPGYPATAGIHRESVDSIPLSNIPVQPISDKEAETLLRILNQTVKPKNWQGGLDFSYGIQGIQMDPNDTRRVTLNVSIGLVKRSVCNVVGTIKGRTEPDRYILLGSPSPSTGTAVLMEVARILLSIRKKGWEPHRTIKLCGWGSRNIGSVEWIEEYQRVLESRAVAYLNVDKGNFNTTVKSNPLLEETAFQAAKKVKVLDSPLQSLYNEWNKTSLVSTGSESGCLFFAYKIGVPCVNLIYRSYNGSSGQTSDSLKYLVALTQVWLQMTFDIARSEFIPFDVVHYAETLCTFIENLSETYNGNLKQKNITLEFLVKAAADFQAAAKTFQDCLHAVDKEDVLKVRMANDRLLQLDRAFTSKEGLPGRPFMRHVALAPSYFPRALDSKFAGITDSIQTAQGSDNGKDWERVSKQISMVTHAFRSAISVLQPPEF